MLLEPLKDAPFAGLDVTASALIAELMPLLTSNGSTDEKLIEVASRISRREGYDTVDFLTLEGISQGELRHHLISFDAGEVAGAWEESVQRKDAFSAFARFQEGRTAVIYNSAQTDKSLTNNERVLAKKYGLGSVLVVPLVWKEVVRGALAVGSLTPEAFEDSDVLFLAAVADHVCALVLQQGLIADLELANLKLSRLQDDIVLLLARVAEAHDETTGAHLRKMRLIAEALASELGFSSKSVLELGQAAVLHDIGKVRVPTRILAKPGPLTNSERKLMENHPVWGEALLTDCPDFTLAAQIARWHHERWDGNGYPDGLRGNEIPLEVAIVTLADSYDAMMSIRPYKTERTHESVIHEILLCSGEQFNPLVVRALIRLSSRGML